MTTLGVPTTSPVTISGIYSGTTKTGTLTVQAASLSSVSLSTSPVVGGTNVTGTVTLNGKAGATNFVVALSSSDTTCATVPATVTVATNATTTTFTVTTLGVAANKSSTITATLAAVPKTVVISTTPAALSSVALSPAAVTGGASSTGTLTLSGNAPPAGAVVSISSTDVSATAPATVTVAANTKTKTFTVTTVAVATVRTATISGTYSGTQSASLTVTPPSLSAVGLTPSSVNAGTSATGTVTITSAAPAGGLVVSLSSDNGAAVVPASVTVGGGATTATFPVTTTSVASNQSALVTATYSGVSRSASLQIAPAGCVVNVASAPSSFPGSDVVWFNDAIPAGATPGGTWIWDTTQKASGTQSFTSGYVNGFHEQYFFGTSTANGLPLSSGEVVVVYALLNPCTPPQEILLQFSDETGDWSHRAYWGPDLLGYDPKISMGALPATGAWVRLEVPTESLNLQGHTLTGFAITLSDGQVWADRVGKGVTGPASLTSLAVVPTTLTGGGTATGTVTLSALAPAGGITVALSSDKTAASVPASVTVAQGSASAIFTVTTMSVGSPALATITASYSGVNKTATLTVNPLGVVSLVSVHSAQRVFRAGRPRPERSSSTGRLRPAV
ncbi:MAG: hypothetical protein ABI584_15685 [Acidobacteriota bacterium]